MSKYIELAKEKFNRKKTVDYELPLEDLVSLAGIAKDNEAMLTSEKEIHFPAENCMYAIYHRQS